MPRPRVVLDTNVIVSAHLKDKGLERYVLDMAIAGAVEFYATREILAEYAAVLSRPKFGISPQLLTRSLRLIDERCRIITPKRHVHAAADPEDNKFLDCVEECKPTT